MYIFYIFRTINSLLGIKVIENKACFLCIVKYLEMEELIGLYKTSKLFHREKCNEVIRKQMKYLVIQVVHI